MALFESKVSSNNSNKERKQSIDRSASLGLSPDLIQTIKREVISEFTPILIRETEDDIKERSKAAYADSRNGSKPNHVRMKLRFVHAMCNIELSRRQRRRDDADGGGDDDDVGKAREDRLMRKKIATVAMLMTDARKRKREEQLSKKNSSGRDKKQQQKGGQITDQEKRRLQVERALARRKTAHQRKKKKKRKVDTGDDNETKEEKIQVVPAAEACPIYASNYVCTFRFGRPMDLSLIQRLVTGQINGQGLRSLHIASHDPRVTFQIFKTGTVVIAGARSDAIANQAAHVLATELSRRLNTGLYVYGFRVWNIVAFGALGFKLDLDKFFLETGIVVADPDCPDPQNNRSKFKVKEASTTSEDAHFDVDDDDDEEDAVTGTKRATSASARKRQQWVGHCWSEYHSDNFKGLNFYSGYPRSCVLFFKGTFVVTGTNKEEEILVAMRSIPDWGRYRLQE